MSKVTTDTTARKSRKPLWIGAGAIAVVLVLAGTFMVPAFNGTNDLSGSGSESTDGLFSDPDAEIARAIAEMNAIAEGAAQGMAAAGAQAEAEFNASAQMAADVVAQAGAEGEAAIDTVANATGVLESPPSGFDGNVSGGSAGSDITAPEPDHSADVDYSVPGSVEEWQANDSSVRARLALGVPLTGNDAIDASLFALVDAYVSVKGNISLLGNQAGNASGGGGIVWNDDDFGTFTGTGEGVSHEAAPDYRRADQAYAHAEALLQKGYAGASTIWSGINATVEAQIELEQTVRAELKAIAKAEAEAQASIQAQLEARQRATLNASAEAQAEAHAEAERKIQLAQEAHVAAKKQVSAQAEAQVQAVYGKSAEASEQLDAQAALALEQAEAVSAQIWASANATLAVLAQLEAKSGTDFSAQASAVVAAAAQAEAAARAKAQATANVLAHQAAMVRAAADVRAAAVMKAAADFSASIDAKLSVAMQMTLRAEAYTIAKIQARAQVTLEAHQKAALAATFRVQAAAKGQAHIIIEAALKANAAAKINLDGSRGVNDMMRTDVYGNVDHDEDIVREVASDYSRQSDVNPQYQQKATEYNAKADHLQTENTVFTGMTYLIENDIQKGHAVTLLTEKNLHALGQQYL